MQIASVLVVYISTCFFKMEVGYLRKKKKHTAIHFYSVVLFYFSPLDYNLNTLALFTQRRFSYETQLCCCSLAFLFNDNSVPVPLNLQTFRNRFQNVI